MDRPNDRPELIVSLLETVRCNRNRHDTSCDKLHTLLVRLNAYTDEWRKMWWSVNRVICKRKDHCQNRWVSSAADRHWDRHEIPMALGRPMKMFHAILCWTLKRKKLLENASVVWSWRVTYMCNCPVYTNWCWRENIQELCGMYFISRARKNMRSTVFILFFFLNSLVFKKKN